MSVCLETVGLSKHFYKRSGLVSRRLTLVKAVNKVSLSVGKGETLGLVGETGSGKTTFARLVLRVIEPTEGKVFLNGRETTGLDPRELLGMRKEMQMVFQDPYSSLNPRMTVGDTIGEPLLIHKDMKREEVRQRVNELLTMVGLSPEHSTRYPHQFSGGQRQRITIARAIATNPSLLVLDEPTSALDVSVQAQILQLLRDLQARFGIAYLFISHNLSVVKYMSRRIATMYAGRVVEKAATEEMFKKPLHPYTQALLAAIPDPSKARNESSILLTPEDVPEGAHTEAGCAYRFLCPYAMDVCKTVDPELVDHGDSHWVACHLYSRAS